MTETKKFRRYAGPGAVRNQQGGAMREIKTCNRCGNEFVFLESKKTGKWYRANVYYGQKGQAFYVGSNFHKCDEVLAERALFEEAVAERARNSEISVKFTARLKEVADRDRWFMDETLWALVSEMTGQGKEVAEAGLIKAMKDAGELQ